MYIYYLYLLHVCQIFSGETWCLVEAGDSIVVLGCRTNDAWGGSEMFPYFWKNPKSDFFFFLEGNATHMIMLKVLPIFLWVFWYLKHIWMHCSLRLNFTSFTRDWNHKLMATWTSQAVHLVEFGEPSDWRLEMLMILRFPIWEVCPKVGAVGSG